MAAICVWHAADHNGQMVLNLRMNGIVPHSRNPSPKLQEKYWVASGAQSAVSLEQCS